MSAWQPISTAPKDGTRILLGRFTGDKQDAFDGFIEVDWYRTKAAKRGFIGFGNFNARHWPPTHWQPLPSPPLSNLLHEGKGG